MPSKLFSKKFEMYIYVMNSQEKYIESITYTEYIL